MAEPHDPAPAAGGRGEASYPPQTAWQRKHRPEPTPPEGEASDGISVNGRLILAIIGGLVSAVLAVAGFLNNLDSGRPIRDPSPLLVPPPQPSEVLGRLLDRPCPPAAELGAVEAWLAAVGNVVVRFEMLSARSARGVTDPETRKMFAQLTRTLDGLRTQLDGLDPSRLSPEERARRERCVVCAEELVCRLAVLTGC